MTAAVAVDQQHTIDVLAEITSRRLPVLGWHLSGVELDRLDGQANGSDEAKREAVAAYAGLLGVEVVERQHDHRLQLTATGTYDGIQVRVYAHVSQNIAMQSGDVWKDVRGVRWRVVAVPRLGDQVRLYLVGDEDPAPRTLHVIDGVRGAYGPLTLVERPAQAVVA